jgi:hypothetical protein
MITLESTGQPFFSVCVICCIFNIFMAIGILDYNWSRMARSGRRLDLGLGHVDGGGEAGHGAAHRVAQEARRRVGPHRRRRVRAAMVAAARFFGAEDVVPQLEALVGADVRL